MSQIVEIIYLLVLIIGIGLGKLPALSASAASAPGTVMEILIGMAGNICFWSGLMEIMAASGLADRLASVLQIPIRWIYGRLGNDRQVISLLARNMAGNLLGLGSAATPSGLEGAARLRDLHENGRIGRVPLCLLAVINTVSIQLIPSSVAATREALGAAQPYDILLPVWCASVCSFLAALTIAKVLLGEDEHA